MEKDEILSRWSDYIGELYNNDNRGDMPDIATEVESPGPDGITTEMIVAAGEVGILELIELSSMIHNQGSFLSELNPFVLSHVILRCTFKYRCHFLT